MPAVTLEALIFDVDGTLADTERDGHRIAFNQAFNEAGLDWNWSVALYGDLLSTTGGKERMGRFLDENPQISSQLREKIPELHVAKTRYYTHLVATTGIALRPGVVRLIREAQVAGLRMAIATTTTPANVDALLSNSELSDYKDLFEVIGAGDVVANKKPAGDIYLHVMNKMGLTAAQCLVIEDSAPGVASAADAGIRSILVTMSDYTKNHQFKQASLIIDNLEDTGHPESPVLNLAELQKLHTAAWV